MSKSSSRLGRPGSAGSKNPNVRKEMQGNRSCMLRVGERLMRAGSEGNLVQRPSPAPSPNQSQASSPGLVKGPNGQTQPLPLEEPPSEQSGNNSIKDPGNSLSRVPSSSAAVDSSAERLLQKKQHTNNSLLSNTDLGLYGSPPCSPNTLPRRYTSAVSASSKDSELDVLMMQHSDVERKKEVFLDHLRQKYPHHAAVIMGHQERMRDQVRSPRTSASPPPGAGVLGLAEQQDLAAETMSEGEVLPPTVPFTRGSRARASLPVARSNSQTRDRSHGVLYLQYGEETKQVRMPSETSGQEALRALFVSAFPHQLTMKMLQSPNMAICIKDTSRNICYDLDDIRNITSHSCLKVYHKDPAHVFNRHSRPAEGRISKEILYGNHSPVHTLSSGRSTLHNLQGSMSPPMVRSMPSSPSRMAYGGGGTRVVDPGSATLPRERLSAAGRSVPLCSSSSAILERRDVKPDEDLGSGKNMALVVRGEGGPHYPDYSSSLQDGGRLSIASSQGSAPPSHTADMVDAGGGVVPAGLQQYRASIKPLGPYGEILEHQTQSLHRQKNRKYGDNQLPPLSTKTPPPSPHRMNEVRMIDGHIIGGVGLVTSERMSPIRRSLRRESNGAMVEIVNRTRGSGSSSSSSSVFVDSPHGYPDRLSQGHVIAGDPQSERIKAMEKQIASLAGLVHHALAIGPNITGVASETDGRNLVNNEPGTVPEPASVVQNPAPLIDGFSPAPLALQGPPSDTGLQQSLALAKRNVLELRLQLNQLRQLQLANQESVSSMLRMAGQELLVLMCDRLAHSEEAGYRRRAEMEEERTHYVAMEERVLTQLSELENYVDHLKRSSTSSTGQLSVTLRDVEEGAVNLRRVGEALTILKSEFPELQVKMRSVLRAEVEAVRFLKEEPHKMDSMLKRVKALTEALGVLRRCVSESTPPARPASAEPQEVLETAQSLVKAQGSPKPQPRSSVRPPLSHPSSPGIQAEVKLASPASPVMADQVKSSSATVIQTSHHHPSPPLTPTHGRDSPTVAKVSPRSRENSPALQKRTVPLQANGLGSTALDKQPVLAPTEESCTSVKHTEICTETTDRETPEGSHSLEASNVSQPITSTSQPNQSGSSQAPPSTTTADFDQILQEAQASLMRSIPDLEVSDTREDPSHPPLEQKPPPTSWSEQETPLDLTLQAPMEQQEALSETPEDEGPKLPDEVDTVQSKPSDPTPAETSQPPAASMEPVESSSAPAEPPAASVDTSATSEEPPAASEEPPAASLEPPAASVEPCAASVKPTAATMEPPPSGLPHPPPNPSTPPSCSRPLVEKPRRSSVEKERRLSPDKAGKSPPPPPPRRFYAANPGLTTARSGEVIFTTRKEPVGAQDEDEEMAVVPQPKPPRQPPEVKPKPQIPHPAAALASTAAPVTASSDVEEGDNDDEEEEEEYDKFMKELQVFQKCTVKEVESRYVVDLSASDPQRREIDPKIQLWRDNPLFNTDDNSSSTPPQSTRVMYYVTAELSNENPLPGENDQCNGEKRTSPTSQVADQNPPGLLASNHQLASQPGTVESCFNKQVISFGLEEGNEAGKDALSPEQKKEGEEEVKQMPLLNPDPAQKLESPPAVTLQESVLTVDNTSPCQKNEEEVVKQAPASNPTSAKEVELLTDATLQKEKIPTIDIDTVSPDQKNRGVIQQGVSPNTVLVDKKVKLTTIVTLQKENVPPVGITSLDQKHVEKVDKQGPAPKSPEKKSNLKVIVTLQKENILPENCSAVSSPTPQQDQPMSSDQKCIRSEATGSSLKSTHVSTSFTDNQSSQQQHQETARQLSRDHSRYTEEGGSLSPYLFDDEGPPPPPPPTDKINFHISKTRHKTWTKAGDQAKTNASEMQTIAVNSHDNPTNNPCKEQGSTNDDFDKTPIVIIFNDPMDFQTAYKRLSTIFESEEDLDRLLSSESIEVEEEKKQEEPCGKDKFAQMNMRVDVNEITAAQNPPLTQQTTNTYPTDCILSPDSENKCKPDSLAKSETKRKFKFKFPKNKLAAISQAIRTGTTKMGKKTLEVVVYEEEEEITSDDKRTKKETTETKRFEINNIKQIDLTQGGAGNSNTPSSIETSHSNSHSRTEELCKSAYDSIESLEKSIQQLEISVDSMPVPSSPSSIASSSLSPTLTSVSKDDPRPRDKVKRERDRSPSKRPASHVLKGLKQPQSKRAKPQPTQETVNTSAKKQTSSGSSHSSGQRSFSKSRHSSSSGSPEKAPKGQQSLQDTQKQFRQANSRGARAAAGDSNHSFLALPASKIPALCHSSGKHSPASLSSPQCSNVHDSLQNLSSSSSSASLPCASSGKNSLLSPPPKSPSRSPSPSSAQRSKQTLLSPPSPVKNSSSSSSSSSSLPPASSLPCSPSPSSPPPPHKSLIPSLNLSRLLPSSSHVSSPSHASASPATPSPAPHHGPRSTSKHQHRLALSSSQYSYYSSSPSSSSSSPSSSSSSCTSSSLSPSSSSSSPPSPSSSLLPTMVSHGARSVRTSASSPAPLGRGKKPAGGQHTPAAASKDAA